MYPIASHHSRPRLERIKGLALALAAAALVAGCGVTVASPSPTTRASAPSPEVSPSLEPPVSTPGPTAASLTTSGVTSSWTDFSWSQLPSLNPFTIADPPGVGFLAWRGGYVVYGTTSGGASAFIWTSADGLVWTQVTAIVAPQVLVAASPTGLVAVAGDPYAPVPSETVWTSPNGVQWRNAGSPSGLAFVDSIAGTATGLVATGHTLSGSGKSATSEYSVAYSADGVDWTPVTVQGGITWDYVGPQVQSGNNRFFVMGGYSDSLANGTAYRLDAFDVASALDGRGPLGASTQANGGVWWSDDGRTWTRSTGVTDYGTEIDFGRDGMLLYTSGRAIPGGVGLDVSSDGGKTWRADDKFGPLGVATCYQGECSVGPDGAIGSNGTVFMAVKSNSHAWISYDGRTWTTIAWDGPSPDYGRLLVLPRGVVAGSMYGAAK